MKHQFKGFSLKSKEDWLGKIQKEYAGKKALADLEISLSDDLMITPYVHPDDDIQPIELNNFPADQKAGIIIESWMKEEDIISFLSIGVSALFIPDDIAFSINECANIKWEMLDVFTENKELYQQLINGPNSIGMHQLVNAANGQISLPDLYNGSLSTDEFKKMIADQISEGLIKVLLGDKLLFQIGVLRGILAAAQKSEKKVQILAFCSPTGTYPEEELVSSTTQSLASRIAGASFIFNTRMQERNKFNHYQSMIHNLLKLESKMDNLADPLSGSYYIENITRQIVALA